MHVDDILFIHSNIIYIQEIARKANQYIKLEEIRKISTFLGNNIIIDYISKEIYIDQKDYTKKLLNKFNIYNRFKPSQILGEASVRLKKNLSKSDEKTIKIYQKEIGSLLFLSLKTRIDITFLVNYYARYISNPSNKYIYILNKV